MREMLWPPVVAFLLAGVVASVRPFKQNLILEYRRGATVLPEDLIIVTQETNKVDVEQTGYGFSFHNRVGLNGGRTSNAVSSVEYGSEGQFNETDQQTDEMTSDTPLPTTTVPSTEPSDEVLETAPVTDAPEQHTDAMEPPTTLPETTSPATTSSTTAASTTPESETTRPEPITVPETTSSTTPAPTTTTAVTTTSTTTTAPPTTTTTSTTTTTTATTSTSRPVIDQEPSAAPPLEEADCNFGVLPELTTCKWKSDGNSSLRWQVSSGKNSNWLGGPPRDFDNADSSGGYMFVETSVSTHQFHTGALLESSELASTGSEGTCLIFGYALQGLSAAELRVLLRDTEESGSGDVARASEQDHVLWQAQYRARDWLEARLLYTCHSPHKLLLEGVPVEASNPVRSYRGFLAVDGIQLRPGSYCQGFCTFAAGFCDWNNEPGDDFDWSLSRGSQNPVTGPSRDSSMDTGVSGGYAFIDSSFPRRPGDRARLVSMTFPPTGSDAPLCMRLWFHMFGPSVGSLRVLLRHFFHEASTPATHTIWELTGNVGNAWFMGEVTVSSLTEFQVLMEATVGNTAMGDIAVDDVSFIQGPCPAAPQVAAPDTGDCTFEVDECGWTSSGNREGVRWERVPTHTQEMRHRLRPHASTQMSYRQNEYFLSLGRMLLQSAGSTTQFTSKEFTGSDQPRCLSFWFFMYEPFIDVSGPSLGVLRVLLQTQGENSRPVLRPIWQLYNNQGPRWNFARAPFTETRPYRVIFEGIWGPNRASGSMAIDDIAFFDGDCSISPEHAMLRPEDCSFERNLCSWNNLTRSRPGEQMVSWQKAFDSHRPAHLSDNTFSTSDGYIFFDIFTTNQVQRQVRLVSPVMNPVKDKDILCFSFWFAAFGAGDTTHLRIVSYPPHGDLDDLTGETLWKLAAQGMDTAYPKWSPAQVTLDNRKPLRLLLEGSASNGGFAVDDIRLLPGACEIRPREARTGEVSER
ncbi:MAM and LDL-receptor class A domain-containing protein 2 [Anabrus simplex]|uniref:MAM and LDL-receptor class A domain-containing protein 2 n=1 Tax=Anabrus simplex TaxID=316456 RepID=UPI0035A2B8A9